jgi:hypothetical protein
MPQLEPVHGLSLKKIIGNAFGRIAADVYSRPIGLLDRT